MQYFYCIKASTYIYKNHKRVNTMKILLADKQDITRAGLNYVISKMEDWKPKLSKTRQTCCLP